MKKLSVILTSVLLVAMSVVTVFAAGINDSEQAVLDELKKSVNMGGTTLVFPADYVNQAESYYNTIDMTAEESEEIVGIIKEGKAYLEKSGASSIAELSASQKQELMSFAERVAAVIDCTVSYDKATKTFKVFDPDGNAVFTGEPQLVAVSAEESGNAGNSSGNNTVAVVDGNAVKTTGGFDLTGVAVAGTVFAVLVAGAVVFLIKSNRERM